MCLHVIFPRIQLFSNSDHQSRRIIFSEPKRAEDLTRIMEGEYINLTGLLLRLMLIYF